MKNKKSKNNIVALSEIQGNEKKILLEKILKKVPSWINQDIDVPQSISIEQSSSEDTALIKSLLINYNSAIDLTGGFGVDSYFFSKNAKQVIYLESNSDLFEIVKKNFEKIGINNVTFQNEFAYEFLKKLNIKVDLIYCDPSRRAESKKVFKLEDSEPNIFDLFDLIKDKSRYFLLKTSPFLDIKLVVNSLENISEIILISIDNELKEVLYLFDFQDISVIKYQIFLINKRYGSSYLFKNDKFEINYSFPKSFLYEPDAAIMKLGNFSEIASEFNLSKLETNTNLFTSDSLIFDFPGKIYKIIGVEKVSDKSFSKYSLSNKFNLKVRNFPDTVENLKKKLKIIDGGDQYIFATRLFDKKYALIICEKVII